MYIKFASLVIAAFSTELLIYGTQSSSDPIFLFVSNNPLVVICRMLLAILLVFVAFREKFTYKLGRQVAGGIGAFLAIVGVISMESQFMIDNLSTYLKLCDYMIFASVGITLAIAAASLPARRRSIHIKKSRLYRYQHDLALKLNQPTQGKQKSAF